MSYRIGERLYYANGAKVFEAEIDDIVKYYNNGDIDTRYKIRYKDVDGMKYPDVAEDELITDLKEYAKKLCDEADKQYKEGEIYRVYGIEIVKGYAELYKESIKDGDFYMFQYTHSHYGKLRHEVREDEIYSDYKDLYEKKFRKMEGWRQ